VPGAKPPRLTGAASPAGHPASPASRSLEQGGRERITGNKRARKRRKEEEIKKGRKKESKREGKRKKQKKVNELLIFINCNSQIILTKCK
jgi:hypothetical protein